MPPLAAEALTSWAGVLVLAGLIALVITLGRLIRRHSGRGGPTGGAYPLPGSGLPAGRTLAEAQARLRETADGLMAEIESLAREARAETETRVRVLHELIARADEAASRLERGPPARPGGDDAPPPTFEEVCRLAGEGLDPAEIASRTSFERGEVELILGLQGLRRRGTGTPRPGGHGSAGGEAGRSPGDEGGRDRGSDDRGGASPGGGGGR